MFKYTSDFIAWLRKELEETTDLIYDGYHNYDLMYNGWKYLDDYYHCKAHYQSAARSPKHAKRMKKLGELKEEFDFYNNIILKGLTWEQAVLDRYHDLNVNQMGRDKAKSGIYNSSYEACSHYRELNKEVPYELW